MIQFNRPLILASGSPRRRELMQTLGLPFQVLVSDADESFPPGLQPVQVPALLSRRKAEAVFRLRPDALVLAADTVVDLGGTILNKPAHAEEARHMLGILSGQTHFVHSAYTLLSDKKVITRTDTASVRIRVLQEAEIGFYVASGRPFDKAGSYGIQDWIGLVAVEAIDGSFFTVMGLPTHRLWSDLAEWEESENGTSRPIV